MTELTPRQIEVNSKIDAIIAGALANNLPPFAVHLLDKVMRPYAHALDFAEEHKVMPPEASFEIANLMGSMVVEFLVRAVDRRDGPLAADQAQAFINNMTDATNQSLHANFQMGATQ